MNSALTRQLGMMLDQLAKDMLQLMEEYMSEGIATTWGQASSYEGMVKVRFNMSSRWMDKKRRDGKNGDRVTGNTSKGDVHYDVKIIVRLCRKVRDGVYDTWDPIENQPNVIYLEIQAKPASNDALRAAREFKAGHIITDFPVTEGRMVLEAAKQHFEQIFGNVFLAQMLEASS